MIEPSLDDMDCCEQVGLMRAETSNESDRSDLFLEETATAAEPSSHSLFDLISTKPQTSEPDEFLDRWLKEKDPIKALAVWIDRSAGRSLPNTARQALRRINREIGQIDQLLNRQLNEVLHHPRFQKLEASWRGVRHLIDCADPDANCKIRLLSLSWGALVRDLDRAIEFDQSQLFKKIYSEEFGTSGGEPYSAILGDYEIHLRPDKNHKTDDVNALKSLTQVMAAAFAPFIASAHPSLFGLDSFQELERPSDLTKLFNQPEYVTWNSLRDLPDSRFLALALPRILMRKPYQGRGKEVAHFPFQETTDSPDEADYLWGNAAYALGGVMIRSFCQNGWLADIRGVRQDRDEGGLITGLPEISWKTDREGIAVKPPVDVVIPESMEAEFSNLGFTALCPCNITRLPAIHSTPSLQKPEQFDNESANTSARLSSMMHYMLCVSRIAHYVKVLGREKIGSYTEAADCEEYLNDWLRRYVTQDDDAEAEIKAKYPLREAEATIREKPGEPGNYYCTIHLQPHYQMDDMVSAVKLTTEISSTSSR